jgi:hypothetical protein
MCAVEDVEVRDGYRWIGAEDGFLVSRACEIEVEPVKS